MTTKEAFEHFIYNLDMLKDAEIPESTYRSWRKRLLENKITLDLMESILSDVAEKVRDEKWKFKKK